MRTNQYIRASNADHRVFSGVVDQDVRGTDGGLAIPRGSNVELIARTEPDDDLILDNRSLSMANDMLSTRIASAWNRRMELAPTGAPASTWEEEHFWAGSSAPSQEEEKELR